MKSDFSKFSWLLFGVTLTVYFILLLQDIEARDIHGTSKNDTLVGSDGNDKMFAGNGNDILIGLL